MPVDRRPEKAWDEELLRLIQHGRDREAAALAAHRLAPTGASMDPRSQLNEIVPLLIALVAPLDEATLAQPTPCATFSVRGVLEHMVGGATMFAAAFRGEEPKPASASDLVTAFPVAMDELQQSLHSVGAMDRTIASPFGDLPADAFARLVALDGLVHGWDIATATGQAYAPSAAVVAAVDAFARRTITSEMRDGDTFAAPVEPPADASPLVRLVAFTGRQI